MLWWLCAGLSVFPITVNVYVLCRPIQTHAAELNSRAIDCMLPGHNYRLLLFNYFPLIAG